MNLELEDYYISELKIKKGKSYSKDDADCRWYDVSFNIHNEYFHYNETRECLLEGELWEIFHTINKCLNNELSEHKYLTFIEHDIELEFSKSNDENHIHQIEFKIFINLEGIVGCDYYSFTLDDEQMIRLRDYIENILRNRKSELPDDEQPYIYASVIYDDDIVAKTINEPSFYYKTILPININDRVLVDRAGHETVGIVIDIEYCDKDNVPYPLEKTKDIIKILDQQKKDDKLFQSIIEPDEDFYTREETIKSLECIELTSENLNLLTENEIVFIEDDDSDGSLYFMDNKINLYHAQVKYPKDKKLTKDLIFSKLPKYKNASYENQKDYKAINLGMGHALLIKTSNYDSYMSLLKNNIKYEDEFNDCYNAYCYWMKYAIEFLENNYEIVKCPNCGNKMVKILYGMPSSDDFEQVEKGKIFLGGCMVSDNVPSYHCNNCRRSYYENLEDYIDEPNNFE